MEQLISLAVNHEYTSLVTKEEWDLLVLSDNKLKDLYCFKLAISAVWLSDSMRRWRLCRRDRKSLVRSTGRGCGTRLFIL